MSIPEFPVLRIRASDAIGNSTRIDLDGQPLDGVTHVTLEVGVDNITTATIHMYVTPDVETNVELAPLPPDEAAAFCRAAGYWR